MKTINAPKPRPLIEQYRYVYRSLLPNTILLRRLGDFYEAFDDCAKLAAEILCLTLTKRNEVLMAGIVCHTKDASIKALNESGYNVAILDKLGNGNVTLTEYFRA